VEIAEDDAFVWKRLVPYNTTPVPRTTDATKIIIVVSTTLIAFLFFVLGNISDYQKWVRLAYLR
jgi:hypothetical protein